MKKRTLITALIAIGMAGGASAQVDQYWNGAGSTGNGWNTTSNEWGATSGADVTQTWTDGNNAIIEAVPSTRIIQENITANNVTATAGGGGNDIAWTGNPGTTLTVNDTLDIGANRWTFNTGYTVAGSALTMVGSDRYIFNNGSTLSANVTTSSRLQMNGTSSLTGDVQLNGGYLAMRWNAGIDQSMGTLSGSGTLGNNPGSGHANNDVDLNIAKLEIGTDGTIGLIDSSDNGRDQTYILKLEAGTHQFDISKSGASLDSDKLDLATGKLSMHFKVGTEIAINGLGDDLELGDSFQLIDVGYDLTGTNNLSWNFNNVTFADAGLSFDTSSFKETGSITVIPEPATLGLIAASGICMLWVRRRFMI